MNKKNVLFLLLYLILLALIVEYSFRFYLDKYAKRSFEVINYEFNYTMNINENNFRDDEFTKEKTIKRVFMIGDSMIHGSGVSNEYTIDKFMERNSDYDVWNLAPYGASPIIYYKVAKKFRGYNPDIIVLNVYVDNDIQTKNNAYGKYLSTSVALIRAVNNIRGQYQLGYNKDCQYAWVLDYEGDKFYKDLACKGLINPFYFQRASVGDNEEYYKLLIKRFKEDDTTRKYILKIKEMYKEKPFFLVIHPSKYQVSTESFKELRKIGFVFGNETLSRGLQNSIINWANSKDIEVIDLLPEFKEQNTSLYHLIDGHYNEKGNELASELILKVISEGEI